MESMIFEAIVNGGPIAAFAGWLAYNNSKQDEKLADMYQRFFMKLEEINGRHETNRGVLEDKYEQRNEQVRERWLNVVQKVEKERDEAQKENQKTIQTLTDSIKELTLKIERLNDKIQ
tara:strand:- start:412 stop:765 length:354 start_codon:yes stop_codon:yes gene_type:complete